MKPEMTVGMLRNVLNEFPEDTPIFVGCQGYCNYDFKNQKPFEDTDTFVIMHDGKLFILDECAIEIGNGETL